MHEYFVVALLVGVGIGFVAFSIVFNRLVGVKPKRNKIKMEPFECGSLPYHQAGDRVFQVKYATLAILFVMFDLETVLLYPWAVSARELGGGALMVGALFILLLFFALVYIWKKGLLNWH